MTHESAHSEQTYARLAACDVIVYSYMANGEYRGSAEMSFDSEGMSFTPKKRRFYFVLDKAFKVSWEDVRELKNEVRKRKRLRFAFRPWSQGGPNRMKITIKEDDPQKLARIAEAIDALPAGTNGLLCPFCGGAVVDKVCQSCHRAHRRVHVRQAVWQLLTAFAMLVGGGLLVAYSCDHMEHKTGFISMRPVFYGSLGMITTGVLLAASGIVTLILKRKTDLM